ncbi:MAG: efflux RND transporter periplasmic adaptor subunit [Verrucomicrobiota bacterium]
MATSRPKLALKWGLLGTGVLVWVSAIAFLIVGGLFQAGPKAEKKERVVVPPAVRILTLQAGEEKPQISTQGFVEPRQQTALAVQVSGRVERVHPNFEAGGVFRQGEVLVSLEKEDYQAQWEQARSDLAEAKLTLELERARAEQAARDWKRLGQGEASSLTLREPQLRSAVARVKAAEANVASAARNLERTEIRAPYDCRVLAQDADVGAFLSPGMMVGTVYSVADFEIRLPVSLEDYGFLARDEEGKLEASVHFEGEVGGQVVRWEGRVLREEGALERETLSKYLVAKVQPNQEAPFGLEWPAVGFFLRAVVEGQALQGVSVVPRVALNQEDQVMVVDAENRLRFRDVEILRSQRETVYVSGGLKAGERIILSRLQAPIEGMEVNVAEEVDLEGNVLGPKEGPQMADAA